MRAGKSEVSKSEVVSFEVLINQTFNFISRGYTNWCLVYLPINKKEKFKEIEQKLSSKYGCGYDKHKRSYRKQKKLANFQLLRYDNVLLILHTPGNFDVTIEDPFYHIEKKKLQIALSETTKLEFYQDKERWTVKLSKSTFQGIKQEIVECCKKHEKRKLTMILDRLNGLPRRRGIVHQQGLLLKEAKKTYEKFNKKGSSKFLDEIRFVKARPQKQVYLDQ